MTVRYAAFTHQRVARTVTPAMRGQDWCGTGGVAASGVGCLQKRHPGIQSTGRAWTEPGLGGILSIVDVGGGDCGVGELDVYVEVRPDPDSAGDLAGRTLTEKFKERVHELGASLGDIANQLRDQLEQQLHEQEDAGWHLEEIGLKFSLDLEAEAGVVVARAATTAGFEASLSWKRHM